MLLQQTKAPAEVILYRSLRSLNSFTSLQPNFTSSELFLGNYCALVSLPSYVKEASGRGSLLQLLIVPPGLHDQVLDRHLSRQISAH